MDAQRTDAWFAARCGQFTASRAADLMARTKSGPSASRGALLTELAIERLTGQPTPSYTNAAMQRGIELEDEARDAYAFAKLVAVQQVAYIVAEGLPNAGCSPDGLVGDEGIVEIKCPTNMAKHLDALRSGAHAVEYRWQLQHQLMVTGRAWNDAVSYHPAFPEGLQLAITRVERDEAAIAELRAAIIAADAEVEAIVAELRAMQVAA
jgi:putative phage-type endonuclease